jgi:O-antigen/teichoic acid export membrane protein
VILTAGHVLVAVLGPLTSYLMMTGRQDAAAVVHVASAAANIVLNLGLIPRFGIVGAAIASSLILVITQLVLWVLARRGLDAMAESKHEVS